MYIYIYNIYIYIYYIFIRELKIYPLIFNILHTLNQVYLYRNNFFWRFCLPIISKSTPLLSSKFLALIFQTLVRTFPPYMKAVPNMQWYRNYNSVT